MFAFDPLRTLAVAAKKAEECDGALAPMSWKIISGALMALGVLCGMWLIYEARSGVAQTRGGTINQVESPQAFWFVIGIGVLWIAFCFIGAVKAWRKGQREPNF